MTGPTGPTGPRGPTGPTGACSFAMEYYSLQVLYISIRKL